MRQLKTTAIIGATLLALGSAGSAQAPYPSQMVRLIAPFSAGSITDSLARILADKLDKMWKQQVIVDNRPGLAGTTSVAVAAPDGYTLMLTSNGHTTAGIINKNIQFDPVKDFAGVTKLAAVPQVAIVPPDLPVTTLKDFVRLAEKSPGKLNFSSAGISSTTYLCFELLKQAAKIDVLHVPYKGTPEATTAVIRGDVQLYLAPIPLAQELIATNKVKAIAVNYITRVEQLPDIATVAESIPSFKCDSWFAVLAPAATSRAIVRKVNEDIATVLKMPDVIDKLRILGAVPSPTTPAELDAQLKSETELYTKLLRDAGIAAN